VSCRRSADASLHLGVGKYHFSRVNAHLLSLSHPLTSISLLFLLESVVDLRIYLHILHVNIMLICSIIYCLRFVWYLHCTKG